MGCIYVFETHYRSGHYLHVYSPRRELWRMFEMKLYYTDKYIYLYGNSTFLLDYRHSSQCVQRHQPLNRPFALIK